MECLDKEKNTEKLFELLKKKSKDKDLIKFIEEHQECLNQKNKDGDTPLIYALKYKHSDNIVKLMINNKTDINQKTNYEFTPLMYALEYTQLFYNKIINK